jgi:SRSO17 transposase
VEVGDRRRRELERGPAGRGLPPALRGLRTGDAARAAHPTAWDDGADLAYFLAYAPANTTAAELLRVCGVRWQIEECFAQAKGEVGLDPYEVRTWDAWQRFVTLCLLAQAGLVVLRLAAHQHEAEKKGAAIPA